MVNSNEFVPINTRDVPLEPIFFKSGLVTTSLYYRIC